MKFYKADTSSICSEREVKNNNIAIGTNVISNEYNTYISTIKSYLSKNTILGIEVY